MTQQTPPNYRMLPDRPCCGTCKHRNLGIKVKGNYVRKSDVKKVFASVREFERRKFKGKF